MAERRRSPRISMVGAGVSCYIQESNQLCRVACMSLTGILIQCPVEAKVGETYDVVVASHGELLRNPFKLSARVVREDEKGTALEFCNTGNDDYEMLKSVLNRHSGGAQDVTFEFQEEETP